MRVLVHRDFDSFGARPLESESQMMFPALVSQIAVAGLYPELGPLLSRLPSDCWVRPLSCSGCF